MGSEPDSVPGNGESGDFPAVRMRTNFGPIVVRLRPDRAPKTVENFLGYVAEGFYDNTVFHRVIAGFVAQGGGYERGMHPKATRPPIGNETGPDGLRNAGLTVSMARTSDPHSATSQFFINFSDNASLDFTRADGEDWGYCVFGEVVDGADVVEAIGKVDTEERMGMSDVPVQDVVIESIRLEESGQPEASQARTA